MGYNKKIYLGQSLDDTIKMRNKQRERPTETKRNESRRPETRRPDLKSRANINSRVGKVIPPKKPMSERTKSSVIISRRLPVQKNTVDPSQIVITKTINRPKNEKKTTAAATDLVINRNIKRSHQAKREEQSTRTTSPPLQPIQQPPSVVEKSKIVLLCNLDPRATAKDIGDTCAMFGPITSCDLLLDPMGRPLYEAEIEFVYPASAEHCVAKLDNKFADGRMLRARLQKSPTLPVKPRYSSRTVVASARVAPGGFNNPTPMIPPQYEQPQPTRQTNHPYYQQYQQQFYNNKRY